VKYDVYNILGIIPVNVTVVTYLPIFPQQCLRLYLFGIPKQFLAIFMKLLHGLFPCLIGTTIQFPIIYIMLLHASNQI
jgi:hypothetical protein